MPAEVTSFVRSRHAAYQTPEATVAAIVRAATGRDAAGIEKVVRGYDSEVYRVRAAGDDFVLRIRRHGGVSYASEAWAIAQCRAAGAPVPEVVYVGDAPLDGETREVMVQRAVPGRPLAELEATLSRAELARVYAQAGEALAAIHSVPAGGFYRRRADGAWDFPDWASVAASAREGRRADADDLLRGGLGASEVSALLALHERGLDEFPCLRPALCHGDFLPGHLFIDDELGLTGVIDFGDFQGGAPIIDLANLRMSAPHVELAWLREGYGAGEVFDERFERRLLLMLAGLQIGYMAHFVRQGNAEEAASLREGIREMLREVRSENREPRTER